MLGSAVMCYLMGLQAKEEVITDDIEGLFSTDMNPGVSNKFGFSFS